MITENFVSYEDRGPYGKNNYRGNCSGYLIKDIIETPMYHILDKNGNAVQTLSDYMVGSGTTEDVCKEMGVKGTFLDLNRGFDLMTMDIPDHPDNIFFHPPYGSMIIYSDNMYKADDIISKYGFDPRKNDLSRAKDWDDFIFKFNYCNLKQFTALNKGGRMFILMGDYKQKGVCHSMLCDMAKLGTLEQVIVKKQFNCWSDRVKYTSNNFVRNVLEWLVVLRKDSAIIINVAHIVKTSFDVRESKLSSWSDIIFAVLEEFGPLYPKQISDYIKDSYKAKCESNNHVDEKIRQVLRRNHFKQLDDGRYCAAA